MGYDTGNYETPIIPLIIVDPGKAQELARKLFEDEGTFTTPIIFPILKKNYPASGFKGMRYLQEKI